MNHEPLSPDPKWHRAQAGEAYPWQSDTVRESISHPPAAYALGFEQGTYALANHLVQIMTGPGEGGETKLFQALEVLATYRQGNAHPARGWEHEPKRS